MGNWRKSSVITLLLCLLATLFAFSLPVTASAHDSGVDHYYGHCENGSIADRGAVVYRSSGYVGSRIRGVSANVVARALGPCDTDDFPGNKGKTMINVSLDGNLNCSGCDNFMQLGFVKHNGDPWNITCQSFGGTFQPNQTYFWWTGQAQPSGGQVCPASWYEGWDDPRAGTTYIFTIDKITINFPAPIGSQAGWKYCIIDTSNVYTDACITQQANGNVTGGVSGTAWWGCENGSSASALGTTQGNTYRALITEMKYRKSSDDTWYYTENSAANNLIDYAPWGFAFPSYYNFETDQIGTGERAWCTTDLH